MFNDTREMGLSSSSSYGGRGDVARGKLRPVMPSGSSWNSDAGGGAGGFRPETPDLPIGTRASTNLVGVAGGQHLVNRTSASLTIS